MLFTRRAGLTRPVTLAIAGVAIAALTFATASGAEARPVAASADKGALYIVQTAGAPLASYTGNVAGIPATKPAEGQKLNTRTWNSKAYRDHLRAQRADVLRRSGVDSGKKVRDFDVAFTGFAARLTKTEVAKLESTPGVVKVWKNTIYHIDTLTTPGFLGLSGPNGTWAKQFGDVSHAGEGIIVGDIDTGFWPESPSFAPLPEPRPDQAIIDAKFAGTCVTGDDHPVACNNKVIGARFYDAAGLSNATGAEFHSPRDFDGHGSHTASTAAGDNGVTATVNGTEIGQISGMAPAARLSVYKALWEQPGNTASGSGIDLVNAIDDAVADGVDVINYSIGDNIDNVSPIEVAFLNAAAAGVFVSAAAGNAGPGASTVDNAMPWETTVAAGTHDRAFNKTVTLGDGRTFTGAGFGVALGSAPLADAANSALAGSTAAAAELCTPGTLDPAKVTGKIVLCRRGVVARTDKSNAVKQAGGVGMIQFNPTPNSLNADFHAVPSIHVDQVAGAAIKAYIAAGGSPTAALSAGVRVTAEAPAVAAFSSRGPSPSSGGDLLKPDIMGPGVDVLAAVAPPNHSNNLFDLESGTSMSTPHVAGIAALIRSKNPTWSPMAVRSAMMTTAAQIDNMGKPIQKDSGGAATPLDFGSGFIRPGSAFDPGLVYDSGPTEWLQYTCGIGVHLAVSDENGNPVDVCSVVGTIDPSNLNYATIAVGDLAGKQTVTRTVTNVTNQASVYVARVQAPAGFTVNVTPPVIVALPHKSVSFKVEITRTTGAFGQFSFGALNWSDLRGHNVRSSIAVRPVALSAPAAITQTGTSGQTALSLRTGYQGTLTAKPFGLTAASVTTHKLTGTNTTFDPTAPAAGPAVSKDTVSVPAGTKLTRFQTFASDYPAGTDVDLFVFDAAGNLVGTSAGGTADETVTLAQSGTFDVYAVVFADPPGVDSLDVKLNTFVVAAVAAGNLTATPASQPATVGGTATVTVRWNALKAGNRYLGVVEYGDGTKPVGMTVVAVNA